MEHLGKELHTKGMEYRLRKSLLVGVPSLRHRASKGGYILLTREINNSLNLRLISVTPCYHPMALRMGGGL